MLQFSCFLDFDSLKDNCNQLANYILYLSEQKPGRLFPISNFYPGIYTSPFCILHIGVYLLQSAESLRMRIFKPRHLYEPCFYSDKQLQYVITKLYNQLSENLHVSVAYEFWPFLKFKEFQNYISNHLLAISG